MDEKALDTGPFDTFAERVSFLVGSPWVFAALAALLVLVRLAFHDHAWLTLTVELCAFAVVVLIHARTTRMDAAVHKKLNALTDGVADLLDYLQDDARGELSEHVAEMKEAVGVEDDV